jgi:hypothetical protein
VKRLVGLRQVFLDETEVDDGAFPAIDFFRWGGNAEAGCAGGRGMRRESIDVKSRPGSPKCDLHEISSRPRVWYFLEQDQMVINLGLWGLGYKDIAAYPAAALVPCFQRKCWFGIAVGTGSTFPSTVSHSSVHSKRILSKYIASCVRFCMCTSRKIFSLSVGENNADGDLAE